MYLGLILSGPEPPSFNIYLSLTHTNINNFCLIASFINHDLPQALLVTCSLLHNFNLAILDISLQLFVL